MAGLSGLRLRLRFLWDRSTDGTEASEASEAMASGAILEPGGGRDDESWQKSYRQL